MSAENSCGDWPPLVPMIQSQQNNANLKIQNWHCEAIITSTADCKTTLTITDGCTSDVVYINGGGYYESGGGTWISPPGYNDYQYPYIGDRILTPQIQPWVQPWELPVQWPTSIPNQPQELKINDETIEKIVKKLTKPKKKGNYIMKRLVYVMVVDPDKRLPDNQSEVYKDDPRLTSLSDSDLLFEIDLKSALKSHNAMRKEVLDEDRTDKRNKDVFLKAVKLSELSVKVVQLATF